MVIFGLLSPNMYVSNLETLLPTILKTPKVTNQERIYENKRPGIIHM
jgi:hypothetical protein